MTIKKSKNGYDLYNKAGTKKLAHHKTRKDALAQERAIHANENIDLKLEDFFSFKKKLK